MIWVGWRQKSAFNAVAMLAFFIINIPPPCNISAFMFTVPLFVSIMAIFFFRELMGPRRLISLFVGFAGALVILRPGIEVVGVGYAFAFSQL